MPLFVKRFSDIFRVIQKLFLLCCIFAGNNV